MREMPPQTIIPDLTTIHKKNTWSGSTNSAILVEKDGAPAIEFNRDDFNVIWLDGYEFTDGTIQFDVKGISAPPQGSFVGIAFRVMNQATYDAVYFRPFNFRAIEAERRAHAVQYISHPDWPWYRLRNEKTGQYEQPITPALDGDKWFHAKVVIKQRQIKVFVNDTPNPVVEVAELSSRNGGSVGIWCFGYGIVANLQIMPSG